MYSAGKSRILKTVGYTINMVSQLIKENWEKISINIEKEGQLCTQRIEGLIFENCSM
jgi:hypothetical protein